MLQFPLTLIDVDEKLEKIFQLMYLTFSEIRAPIGAWKRIPPVFLGN